MPDVNRFKFQEWKLDLRSGFEDLCFISSNFRHPSLTHLYYKRGLHPNPHQPKVVESFMLHLYF